jgi:hypothetical protein
MARNENTKNKGSALPTANPKAKTSKHNFNDNSLHNERLKLLGYLIATVWNIWTSEHGIKHRITHYLLIQKQCVEV